MRLGPAVGLAGPDAGGELGIGGGSTAAARASWRCLASSRRLPCLCLEIYRIAAAGCPGSLRCPDVGAGTQRAPAPASSHRAIYACSGINTIDKAM